MLNAYTNALNFNLTANTIMNDMIYIIAQPLVTASQIKFNTAVWALWLNKSSSTNFVLT